MCWLKCGVMWNVRCGVWAEVVRCVVRYTHSLPGAAELRRENSSSGSPVFKSRLAPLEPPEYRGVPSTGLRLLDCTNG